MSDVITAFLMDDHEVVRQGVRALLEATGEIRVVGEASTAAEALSRIPAVRPDVAILDVRVPDGNGIEVCREVRSRVGTHCLMLTSYSDDEALFEAIMAGASGYVLKQIRGTELLSAVKRVAAGESLLDPAITGRVLQHYNVGTMTRRSPNVALAGCDELEINPADADREGVGDGTPVRVASQWGATTARARRTARVPAGMLFLSFHFPETHTNRLVGPHADPVSGCPAYKTTAVRLSPVGATEGAPAGRGA